MYVLADCNNFFVSCERLFAPQLNHRPVVVLSGNDGCVIARSNEAKAIAIPMCAPLFTVRDLIRKHNVYTCSSNITLYSDISKRVMAILKRFSPSVEVYSIDEAFMDFSGTDQLFDLDNYIAKVAKYIYRATGIPVSFGIAPTKTLAKIASTLAKNDTVNRYYRLSDSQHIKEVLTNYKVGDVWGVGRKGVETLHQLGIYSAQQLADTSQAISHSKLSILTKKTAMELQGIPCFEFEDMPSERESISSSRSFSREITEFDAISETLAHFMANVQTQLTKQNSVCDSITVYIQTNRFKRERYYFNSTTHQFEQHTDSLLQMTSIGTELLKRIFLEGYGYKKCGVILGNIIPKMGQNISLFNQENHEKHEKLSKAISAVNSTFGKDTLISARKGFGKLPVRKDNLSAQFTTSWDEILTVNCKI